MISLMKKGEIARFGCFVHHAAQLFWND